MTERTVTVHLNAAVTRYLRNMKQAEDQTARVREELRGLDEEASHLTRAGLMSSLAALPGLLSPIGAGLIALPGLGLGAAASLGSVAVAAQGMGDAFTAVNEADPEKLAEALQRLSSAGREFVTEYQRVRPTLEAVGDGMQDALITQLRGDLDLLVTSYLPTMLNQLPRLSTAMGKLAHEEVALLTSPHIVASVNKQIAQATDLTEDWTRFLKAGTEILFDLADAGADFNRGLVGGLADGTEALRDWIRQQAAVGRLNDVLENGAAILEKVGDVAQVSGELLFDMMASPALRDASETFLDVMGIGLQMVQSFLDVFHALPGPLQSGTASLIAVGGAAMLLFSRLRLLRGATLAAINHLGQMGPMGVSAANGLERTTRWAGRAAAAFVALQLAGAAVTAGAKDLNPQIDAMEQSLRDFAQTGRLSGEAARILGDDMARIEEHLKFLADTNNNRRQTARWLQDALESIPLLGEMLRDVNPTSLTHTRERVGALDQALADMVRAGHGNEARAIFERLAASQARYGVNTQELLGILPQYAGAAQVAGGATQELARSHANAAFNSAILSDGLRGAVREAGSLLLAFERLRGGTIAFAEAEIEVEESIDRLSEAISENGKTLDINTAKGRENKQLVLDSVQAAIEAAQAKYDETVATQGETAALQHADGVYRDYIQKLRDAMLAAGMKKDVVDELLKRYASMPPLIATEVTTPGLDAAIAKHQRLLELRRLLGSKAAAANYDDGSSYVSGRRWGGITVHARDGVLREAMVATPQSPARYSWAEPATGGEAFVPKHGNYGRSMSILSEAAGWYGASVVPGGGGGGVQTIVHEHRHTIEITGREMWSGFRRQVDRLGGDVQAAAGRKAR